MLTCNFQNNFFKFSPCEIFHKVGFFNNTPCFYNVDFSAPKGHDPFFFFVVVVFFSVYFQFVIKHL